MDNIAARDCEYQFSGLRGSNPRIFANFSKNNLRPRSTRIGGSPVGAKNRNKFKFSKQRIKLKKKPLSFYLQKPKKFLKIIKKRII